MPTQESRAGTVLVLHKALDVLEAIERREHGIGLAALASELSMPKATAHRILATLECRGYLDRTRKGDYRVARRRFLAHDQGLPEERVKAAALPVMRELVETFRETVNLGILDCGEIILIETIESPQAVRMSSKVGNRRYVHSTALGKVMLSDLPEKDVLRMLRMKGMTRMTANTITSQVAFLKHLRQVRRLGYAIDNQEHEPDGRCIGAPIREPRSGKVVAGLSISGPTHRMTKMHVRTLLEPLQQAARRVALNLVG